jgi:hypothetical protein
LGDEEALAKLHEAVETQGKRGWPFRKSVLTAFGSAPNPAVASELLKITKGRDANNEVVGGIFWRLYDNEALKNTAEGAGFVRDFVLKVDGFNDQMKSRALDVLEEAKAPVVKPVLEEIVSGTKSERLRTIAQKILDTNFPR